MKITLLQQDICWANPTENKRRTEEAILNAPYSDLYVLPEMWSTGFGNPSSLIDHGFDYDHDDSLDWMKSMALRLDCAIAGSLSVKDEDGNYRNRLYFVTPSDTYFYDKHHLFSYGNEHLAYTAGDNRTVVEWRGVKFLLLICYDLRFPCFSRNGANLAYNREKGIDKVHDCNALAHDSHVPTHISGCVSSKDCNVPSYDYDCAIYVASWPTSRLDVWRTLLKARALENQCYVLGVNRTGDDPNCSYSGGTCAFNAYGKTIAECHDSTVMTCTFDLDMTKLYAFREKFPVLMDRR